MRVHGLEFRVQGSGFRVQGSGVGVGSLGFELHGYKLLMSIFNFYFVVRPRLQYSLWTPTLIHPMCGPSDLTLNM